MDTNVILALAVSFALLACVSRIWYLRFRAERRWHTTLDAYADREIAMVRPHQRT